MDAFQKLLVWQKAHALTLRVYQVTKTFPKDEQYGLVSQMRRAAASAPAIIAEGTERTSVRDRKHFHEMARTSLEELKYHIILSHDLQYISAQEAEKLTEEAQEVSKMLRGLDRSL